MARGTHRHASFKHHMHLTSCCQGRAQASCSPRKCTKSPPVPTLSFGPGVQADKLEWLAVWLLCKDEHGTVNKADILGVMDGSFFHDRDRVYQDKQVRQ